MNRTFKAVAGIAFLFMTLVAAILYLAARQVISAEMTMLMFIGLIGVYFSFGVLIAVYRLINRLK